MDKRFTKTEFKRLTNEVMRVAREINDVSIYTCSISLDKDYICLTIHKGADKSIVTMLYFQIDRYCEVKSFKGLFNLCICLPKVKFGKYLELISQSYVNCDKSERYFSF